MRPIYRRISPGPLLEPAMLRQWKVQYISDYVRYLEEVLYRIKDQIDY
jgi:hypothetical protein